MQCKNKRQYVLYEINEKSSETFLKFDEKVFKNKLLLLIYNQHTKIITIKSHFFSYNYKSLNKYY